MRRFASILGALMVVNAVVDILFPQAGERFMTEGPGAKFPRPLVALSRDLYGLSVGTRRFLSAWELVMAALLLSLSIPRMR